MSANVIENEYYENAQNNNGDTCMNCYHPVSSRDSCNHPHCTNRDKAMDRHYRNGFIAGWNAAISGDDELLKIVEERVKI